MKVIASSSNLLGKITAFIVICFLVLPVQAKYGGGTGEPNNPYQIRDANHMQAIGADANDWDKCFILMADINLSQYDGKDGREKFNIIAPDINDSEEWFQGTPFTGVFDGNNHKISNFTYDSNDRDYIGLFGYIDSGEIRNIGLINTYINAGTGDLVGFLSGHIVNPLRNPRKSITNCYAEGGIVMGHEIVGGLVGFFGGSFTISNCYTTANVEGVNNVGGLVGSAFIGTAITNCYTRGSVDGNDYVGGLVGHDVNGPIINCYTTGSIDGNDYVGGFVGYKHSGLITNCFWDVETSDIGASGDDNFGATGKTTAEMNQQATFTDWDFINTWNIGEKQTYPYLRIYLPSDLNKDRITNFLDIAILCNQWLKGK